MLLARNKVNCMSELSARSEWPSEVLRMLLFHCQRNSFSLARLRPFCQFGCPIVCSHWGWTPGECYSLRRPSILSPFNVKHGKQLVKVLLSHCPAQKIKIKCSQFLFVCPTNGDDHV